LTRTKPDLINSWILDRVRSFVCKTRKASSRWALSAWLTENEYLLSPSCFTSKHEEKNQEKIFSRSLSICASATFLAREISLTSNVLAVSSIFLSPKERSFSLFNISKSR